MNSTNRKYTSQPVIGVYSLIVNQIFYILKYDFGKIWIPPIENILPSHWSLPVIAVYSLMVTRIFYILKDDFANVLKILNFTNRKYTSQPVSNWSIFPICHPNCLHSQKIFWKNLNFTKRKYTSQPVIKVYSLFVTWFFFFILKNDLWKFEKKLNSINRKYTSRPVFGVDLLYVTWVFYILKSQPVIGAYFLFVTRIFMGTFKTSNFYE